MAEPTTAEVRAAVRAVAQGAADDLMAMGQKLADGDLNLSAFALGARATVKAAHLAATAAAAGGFAGLTPSQVGKLGAQLKGLYGGLTDLEFRFRSDQVTAAQFAAYASGYARAAAATYESVVRARAHADGATMERRVIGSAHPCASCDAYAAEGWQPVGVLPAPGEGCQCRGNCLCHLEYQYADEAATAGPDEEPPPAPPESGPEPVPEPVPEPKPKPEAAPKPEPRPRSFRTNRAADAYAEAHLRGWESRLTDAEKQAVGVYKNGPFSAINGRLRHPEAAAATAGGLDAGKFLDRVTADLDSALARSRLPEPLVAWRGVRQAKALGLPAGDAAIGATIRDRAFVSTSLSRSKAEDFAAGLGEYDGALIRINLPAGTHAGWLDSFATAKKAVGERELLLPRGATFRVSAVSEATINGTTVPLYTLDYLP